MFALLLTVAVAAPSPGRLVSPPKVESTASSQPTLADPGAFSRVHVAGDIDLDLFSSEPKRSAVIDCPTSEGPGLQLQVQGDTLMVTPMHTSQRTSGTCKLTLRAPTVAGIQVSGAAKVRGGALAGLQRVELAGSVELDLRGIQADNFSLTIRGAGSVRLSGKVDAVSLVSEGAAGIHAKDLLAQSGTLKTSGAGDITATLKTSGQATAAGAGSITVYGQPADLSEAASGMGQIIRK